MCFAYCMTVSILQRSECQRVVSFSCHSYLEEGHVEPTAVTCQPVTVVFVFDFTTWGLEIRLS